MRVFSPGWNFSPARQGEIGVRLYESCQPGLEFTTAFAPKSWKFQTSKWLCKIGTEDDVLIRSPTRRLIRSEFSNLQTNNVC